LLDDASPMTRSAAAAALGNLGDKSSAPSLRKLLADNDPSVRATAAVALAKLGDASGTELITSMINSDVPDVRLFAAEAYQDRPSPEWVDAIRPSLSDPNGLNRLIAANRLARADPEAARATLLDATADANPVIRMEAAKILVRRQLAPTAVLRKLLRDADPWVRLRGCEGLMDAGRTPSPRP
jgi:HEAT repeat protein